MWLTEHDLLYRESFFSEQIFSSSESSLIDLVLKGHFNQSTHVCADWSKFIQKKKGTRAFLGTQKFDPKKGQRFDPEVFGDTDWVTYAQFGHRLRAFGLFPFLLSLPTAPPC